MSHLSILSREAVPGSGLSWNYSCSLNETLAEASLRTLANRRGSLLRNRLHSLDQAKRLRLFEQHGSWVHVCKASASFSSNLDGLDGALRSESEENYFPSRDGDRTSTMVQQHHSELVQLIGELEMVQVELLDMQRRHATVLETCDSERKASLHNFLHYIALRNLDLRDIQLRLNAVGLSSLSWNESHILGSINSVLLALRSLLAHSAVGTKYSPSCNPVWASASGPSPQDDNTAHSQAPAPLPTFAPYVNNDDSDLSGVGMLPTGSARTGLNTRGRWLGNTSVSAGGGVRSPAGRAPGPHAHVNNSSLVSAVEDGLEEWGEADDGLCAAVTMERGLAILQENTEELLGPEPDGRRSRIMVTLPADAASDKEMVRSLLAMGMNVARVNCAHDGPSTWQAMIENVRHASAELGVPCQVLMDLAGPKLRTGTLEPGPKVAKVRPRKAVDGRVCAPAHVHLSADPAVQSGAGVTIPVTDAKWLKSLRVGDDIMFRDLRGKLRSMEVAGKDDATGPRREGKGEGDGDVSPPVPGAWAECPEVAYIGPGLKLGHKPNGKGKKKKKLSGKAPRFTRVGEIPSVEVPIELGIGDTLVLTRADIPGAPAELDEDGRVLKPAHMACTLDAMYLHVKPGEPVLLDDGKIKAVARLITPDEMVLEVTHVNGRAKLRGEKSINFPASDLKLKGLTPKDLEDLDFVTKHADAVAYSFVNDAEDVEALQVELAKRDASHLGIVLKIETGKAFENLPQMLFQGYRRRQPLGVMIARGDLFVEVGWERMGEVQDQILWICEAAHVPTIWATQVLENLAKTGAPSRPEITDAICAQRAECVMLNKGAYILEAVASLANILKAAKKNQHKKQPCLRPLSVCKEFELSL